MSVSRLRINQFRNLVDAELKPVAGFNVVYGANGSGKTSLLEAIHVLGTGKSFRSGSHRVLVRYGEERFSLNAVLSPGDHFLGVARSLSSPAAVSVDQTSVRSASVLAERLPVLVISMNDFRLFEDGPRIRRAFVDWGVFHSDASNRPLFTRFQKALKQRNYLLKNDTMDKAQLASWDAEFLACAEALDAARTSTIARLEARFSALLTDLGLDELKGRLTWSYFPGWNTRKGSLAEQLASAQVQEKERLYRRSVIGPQRAELRFVSDGHPAADVLSRGQMKIFAHLLKLAQAGMLDDGLEKQRIEPVLLLDDVAAELDSRYLGAILELLDDMRCQVFISAVSSDQLPPLSEWAKKSSVALFHVEHGAIKTKD